MSIVWKGVFPAVTTKFSSDGQLDLSTFCKNLEAQINAGCHGLVLGGTLGEASTLNRDEKDSLLEAALLLADNRVPVVMNVAESSTKDALLSVKRATQLGANGLMVLPPMRYTSDERETATWFRTIAEASELPILVYNNPVDYKIEVTLEIFGQLADYPNVQAVKESTRDLTNIVRMRNAFGDRFKLLCGVDTLALESLMMGADGWVAGLVCAFPRETVAIYELVQQGRYEEARKIYSWFMPLLELDINSKLVQNIKLAEVATGLGTENVRPPRLPLEGNEREIVLKIIETALNKRPDLPKILR